MKLVKILDESNRVDDFKNKSKNRYFATISAYIDKDYYEKHGNYTDKSYKEYCERATNSLLSQLKRLSLDYQKTTGAWYGSIEKSFLVWNTAYRWEQFVQIMLKLNELYKQWGICIGKFNGESYEITMYETDSLEDIDYHETMNFTTVQVSDALKDFGTVLTRHIYNGDGEIDSSKVKDTIKFESVVENRSLASSESVNGAYVRNGYLKRLLEATSFDSVDLVYGKGKPPIMCTRDALCACNNIED